jgi:hypothetical protein
MLVMMLDEGPGGFWKAGGSNQIELRVILGSEKGLGALFPVNRNTDSRSRRRAAVLGPGAVIHDAANAV